MAFQDSRSVLGRLIQDAHEFRATATSQDFDLRRCAVTSSCHWNVSRIPNHARPTIYWPFTPGSHYGHASTASVSFSIGMPDVDLALLLRRQATASSPEYFGRTRRKRTRPAAQYGEA